MMKKHICITCALLLAALQAGTACTPIAEGAQRSATSLTKARDDTAAAWAKLFTYNPTVAQPQMPSTRYCYQFQTDIVCYDTPQPQLTAKLVGAQTEQGAAIIRQPSAAELNAYATSQSVVVSDTVAAAPVAPIDTSATVTSSGIEVRDLGTNKPFYPKQSPYIEKR